MKSILFVLLFAGYVHAGCDGTFKIDKGARQGTMEYVVLEKGVSQKFCLEVPKADKTMFVEIGTVNLANTQCSDVRMTVNPPGVVAPKLHSMGSQPGVIGKYKPGKWVVKMLLKEGCNKYTINARW